MNNPATLALALLGLTAAALVAQKNPKPAPPDQTNVLNCTKGLSGCDISVLTPDQNRGVGVASKKRNSDYCLEGSALCDPTRLTGVEAKAVQAAHYRRNLEKCVDGSPTCEPLLLNVKDLASANGAAAQRN